MGDHARPLLSSTLATDPRAIPLVVKSGSACSPRVLSPVSEDEPTLGLHSPSQEMNLLGSLSLPVHPSQAPGQLPLFSPSEDAMDDATVDHASRECFTTFAEMVSPGQGLPTPPTSKSSSQKLRLPSFDLLGIAAPHPDRIEQNRSKFMGHPTGLSSRSADDLSKTLGATFPFEYTPLVESREVGSHLHPGPLKRGNPIPDQTIITPPDELTLSDLRVSSSWASAPERDDLDLPSSPTIGESTQQIHVEEGSAEMAGTTTATTQGSPRNGFEWVEDVVSAIASSVDSSSFASNSMKVLSHALPFPSVPGHHFQDIISQVKLRFPPSQLVWINLLHAVPGQFNLGELPTSPPSTPGQAIEESEDYFTTKVFESAVSAVNYEEYIVSTSRAPPLAAPSSVNLSIVERYIPPSSSSEFADLFKANGSSLLVDRLIELSPGTGSLLFVYPTRVGGQTFLHDYLGPVLDPVLRSMVVVNNFTSDFSSKLGRMPAVNNLMDFETMQTKAIALCKELSENTPRITQKHHGLQGSFSITHSSKQEVRLERKVWADWWCRQQKRSMRAAVKEYFQRAQRAPAHAAAGQYLIQELLDGVATRTYETPPTRGIEVGVFVIRRET